MNQLTFFELSADDLARKKRMAAIIQDRKLARYLMRADSDEKGMVKQLTHDYTLAEAIRLCMENPRHEDCY